jgi:hypothetical protein
VVPVAISARAQVHQTLQKQNLPLDKRAIQTAYEDKLRIAEKKWAKTFKQQTAATV